MAKLAPTMIIKQGPKPYLLKVATPWRPGIAEAFKCYPGARWNPGDKTWTFPVELRSSLDDICTEFKFLKVLNFPSQVKGKTASENTLINKECKAYQSLTIVRGLAEKILCINLRQII